MSSVFKLPKVGLEAIKKKKVAFAKELAAELLGTMLLVMIGCGSAMSGDGEDGEGQMSEQAQYVRIALAFGLAVATIAQTVGHISGCHINPAITVGLVAGAKVEVIRGLAYVVAQSLGGLLGAALLNSLVPDNTRGQSGLGSTQLGNGVSLAQGFGIEFFISLVLVLVVFGAAADENNAANVKVSKKSPQSISHAHCLGLRTSPYWTFHHCLPSLCHSTDRSKHEPCSHSRLQCCCWEVRRPLALLAGSHPGWACCWPPLPGHVCRSFPNWR